MVIKGENTEPKESVVFTRDEAKLINDAYGEQVLPTDKPEVAVHLTKDDLKGILANSSKMMGDGDQTNSTITGLQTKILAAQAELETATASYTPKQSSAVPTPQEVLVMVEQIESTELPDIAAAKENLLKLHEIKNQIADIEARESDLGATPNGPNRNKRKMPSQDANDLLDLMNRAKMLRQAIQGLGFDPQTLTVEELDSLNDQLVTKKDELKHIADDLAASEKTGKKAGSDAPASADGTGKVTDHAGTQAINEATAREMKIHIRAINIEMGRNQKKIGKLVDEVAEAKQAKEEADKLREKIAGIDIGKIEEEIGQRKARLKELEGDVSQIQEDLDKRAAELKDAGMSEDNIREDVIITNCQRGIERKVQVIERISTKLELLEQQLKEITEAQKLLRGLDAKAEKLAELEKRLAELNAAQQILKRHLEEKTAYLNGKTPAVAEKVNIPDRAEKQIPGKEDKNAKPTVLKDPQPEKAQGEKKTFTKEEGQVINDYANLLRAKQRVRNALAGYKENGSWLRNAARFMLNIENDDKYLSRESEIRRNFVSLVNSGVVTAGDNREAQKDVVKDVYGEVAKTFAKGRSKIDKALMWLRKPSVTWARLGIGVALLGAAALTGGVAAIAGAVGVASTLLGGAGRYVSVDAGYDKVRQWNTGKAKKGEYAVANSLMYANPAAIGKKVDAVYADGKAVCGDELDKQSMRAAKNVWINRIIKKTLAVAAAVLPPFVMDWIQGNGGETNPTPAPKPVVVPDPTPVPTPLPSDLYTVPDNGGIWHICEKIAADKVAGFDHLSVSDQNIMLDAMKDQIVADPAKFGLEPSEIIPRALDKGGPWLRKGADLIYTNSNLQDAIQHWGVPHRIADVIGLKNMATAIPGARGALSGAAAHAASKAGLYKMAA